MFGWITDKISKHRANKKHQALIDAIHNPALFNDVIREYLKQCFPEQWTHFSNFIQLDIFKIAITLSFLGYKCSNDEEFVFCIQILSAQNICEINKDSPLLLRRK
jgi:hypothetical protein